MLLGRAAVLGRADALLDGLRGGRGGLLWLRGEAGIGKTALLGEIGRRAAERGARVLRGTAVDESTGAPAFWLWTQVLRDAAGGDDPDGLVALGGARARRAVDLVGAEGSSDATDQPANRFPLYDAVQAVLDGLTADGPVVLLLDDLHWADEGSLHVLRFLLPGLATRPLLVVCGWRDHEAAPGSDRAVLAAELAGAGESWPLGGLEASDVAALVADTGGQALDADEASTVAARTGGNPLFVSEMARLAAARGAAVSAMVPDTAQGTIRRRVARLPQPAQHVLTVAAVLGQEARLDAVRRLAGRAGLDGPGLAEAEDALAASGLARTEGDRLVVSHALVREAVYDAVPAASRRELHLAAADLPGLGPAEVAGHLLRALPVADRDRVVTATEAAARAAREVQAWEEAARLYRQALDLTTPGDPARPGLLRGAGAALLDVGDLDGARVLYVEAAELARRDGDARALAEAALGFAAGLGGFEVRLFDREQNDLLAEALAALGDDEPALRVHLMARLAVGLAFTDQAARIPALADEAVALARATGDARALGAALAAHCDAYAGPDHVAMREAEAGEIIATARAVRDLGLELLGLRLRVVARWERGAMLEAATDVRSFTAIAERLGQPIYSFYVPLWRGLAAHAAGDLATVRRCADEVAAYAGPADSRNAAVLAEVQRAWSDLERGATTKVMRRMMEIFGEHVELAPDGGAVVALYAGQDAATRGAALPHLPRLVAELPRDKEWLPNLYGVTGGLLEGDVRGEAPRLVHEALAPYGHLFLVDGIGAGFMGSVERPLAVLAWLAGDLDAAQAHFERALVADQATAPLPLANTRRLYAEMLGERDAPGDAALRAELVRQADDFYRTAGITERVSGPATAAAPVADGEAGTWRRTGAGWSVTFRGTTADVPPVKGMADLARLLAEPGREVHALDLLAATSGGEVPRQGDLGPVLDDTARAAYRRRLEELEERIADAEADGDAAAADRAQDERDALVAELTGAYGLGGRARRTGDPAERARTTVTSRVRDAVARVERVHPELGRHLRASVRTGLFCSYQPERPVVWDVSHVVGPGPTPEG